ncbi:hypothetical protein [Ectopseudomonas khazarica]
MKPHAICIAAVFCAFSAMARGLFQVSHGGVADIGQRWPFD